MIFLFFILSIPIAFLCTGDFHDGLFVELKKPDYERISQANVLLLSAIREDFGVSVYLKEKPDDVINIETVYSFEPVQQIDNTYLNRYLCSLIKVFKKYSKEGLELIPDTLFLCEAIEREDGEETKELQGVFVPCQKGDFFVLNYSRFLAYSVHHEIFHSVLANSNIAFEIPKELFKKECSEVSSYACTSWEEFLCDAWGFSFVQDKKLEIFSLLKEQMYPHLISF